MKEVIEAGVQEAITLRKDYVDNIRSVKGDKHALVAEVVIAVFQQGRAMASLMRITQAPEEFQEVAKTILSTTHAEILRTVSTAFGVDTEEVKSMLTSVEGLFDSVENNISHKLGLS